MENASVVPGINMPNPFALAVTVVPTAMTQARSTHLRWMRWIDEFTSIGYNSPKIVHP